MSSRAIQMEEFNLTLMNKYTWFDYNTHTYILGSYHIYHMNCVCKLCICEHSDKHMPDPNRNLEKSNPRKYI